MPHPPPRASPIIYFTVVSIALVRQKLRTGAPKYADTGTRNRCCVDDWRQAVNDYNQGAATAGWSSPGCVGDSFLIAVPYATKATTPW